MTEGLEVHAIDVQEGLLDEPQPGARTDDHPGTDTEGHRR